MTEQTITPQNDPWTTDTTTKPRNRLPLTTTHDGPFNDRIQIKSTQGSANAGHYSGYFVTIETGEETLVFTPDEARAIAASLTQAADETALNERLDTNCSLHDAVPGENFPGSSCTCDA
ncbi:hypothetical protein [Streptomyces hokutonensis]|uniref:hypothetical protein n=1 Tax=Streptomyces hokutonensis TaxID=1306990 RepID=UPI0003605D49|nr:hypothetical protein [Streptomyces hokutonensis]